MSVKSPFAIQKDLIGIGGEPKSVKRLRSRDLLIETASALQTSFLLVKSFLNRPVTVSPHKSLNSCRGVISEPDLLGTSDSEILEGFSAQGVTQVRRITIKNVSTIVPTKHLILTFNSPKLPNTIKAGYLHCKILPYIPNPLRCFKCQRFGHSQTACRGQLTCSRCASVGHASSDCTLEQRCVNCSQPHSSDSKLSQKSDPTASNGEHFNAPEVPQCAKRNSRNRRKRSKVQKAGIKIQMAPHRPRKSTPTESTTDEEDMIMYDVQAEELEPNPEDKFAVMECFVNNPSAYMRALTPTRFRNSNN
ncbi:uncharacterized protein TNCV_2921731 [Trichonephila clavipes]|nr:uncharacterized protein TNCV_2921731 [Trichonephila clavipes]